MKEKVWLASVLAFASICQSAINMARTLIPSRKRLDWIMKKSWCEEKLAVAGNSEFARRAKHNARLRERRRDTLPSYPQATSTSTEDFCFYTGRQFGDHICEKMRGGKKRRLEESKDVPPFNNVTNILISKNKTSSSSFLLIWTVIYSNPRPY